jgi:hypothetical protein
MKITKSLFSIIALSFVFISCGNSNQEIVPEEAENNALEVHDHDDESEAIVLNNGEKWRVDENMLVHIRNMENDVSTFSQSDQQDNKALAEKLQTNIALLTSNCTMTGQAHDELHKWLLPFIDMADAFSAATNQTEAAVQFKNIQNSFLTFNQFFQ